MASKRLRCDCGTQLALNRTHVGHTVRCPKCGLGWQVSEKDFQAGPVTKSRASTGRHVAIASGILLLLALLLLCWSRGGDSQRGTDVTGQRDESSAADSRSNLASESPGIHVEADQNKSAASARPATSDGDEPYALFAGVGQPQAPKNAPSAPAAPPASPSPAATAASPTPPAAEGDTEKPATPATETLNPVDSPTPAEQPQQTNSESEAQPAQQQTDQPASTSTDSTRRPTGNNPAGDNPFWSPNGGDRRTGTGRNGGRGGNNRGGRGGRGR